MGVIKEVGEEGCGIKLSTFLPAYIWYYRNMRFCF